MNRDWANEQGAQTSKTPTCLLLKTDLSFYSFGYEAMEKYGNIQGEKEEKDSTTLIKAANGQPVKAKTLVARCITFLKDKTIKVICQRRGDHFSPDDFPWVLIVPAIWTPIAKHFMREAAYQVMLEDHILSSSKLKP